MDASCAPLDRVGLAPDSAPCSLGCRRHGSRRLCAQRPTGARRSGAALPERGDSDRQRQVRRRLRRGAADLPGPAGGRPGARGPSPEPAALPARPGRGATGRAAAARGTRSRERRHLRPHLRLVPRRAGAVRSIGAVGTRPAREDHIGRAGSPGAHGQAGRRRLLAARGRQSGGAGARGAGDDRAHVQGVARSPVRAHSLDRRSGRRG